MGPRIEKSELHIITLNSEDGASDGAPTRRRKCAWRRTSALEFAEAYIPSDSSMAPVMCMTPKFGTRIQFTERKFVLPRA